MKNEKNQSLSEQVHYILTMTEEEKEQFRLNTVVDFNNKMKILFDANKSLIEKNWTREWIYHEKSKYPIDDNYEIVCRYIYELMVAIYMEKLEFSVTRPNYKKNTTNLDFICTNNEFSFYIECCCPDKGRLFEEHSPHEFLPEDAEPGPMGIGENYSYQSSPKETSRRDGLRWTHVLKDKSNQINKFVSNDNLPVILFVNSFFTNDHPSVNSKLSSIVTAVFGIDPTLNISYINVDGRYIVDKISIKSKNNLFKNSKAQSISSDGFLTDEFKNICAIVHIKKSFHEFLNSWHSDQLGFNVIDFIEDNSELILNNNADNKISRSVLESIFSIKQIEYKDSKIILHQLTR